MKNNTLVRGNMCHHPFPEDDDEFCCQPDDDLSDDEINMDNDHDDDFHDDDDFEWPPYGWPIRNNYL